MPAVTIPFAQEFLVTSFSIFPGSNQHCWIGHWLENYLTLYHISLIRCFSFCCASNNHWLEIPLASYNGWEVKQSMVCFCNYSMEYRTAALLWIRKDTLFALIIWYARKNSSQDISTEWQHCSSWKCDKLTNPCDRGKLYDLIWKERWRQHYNDRRISYLNSSK